MMTQSDPLLHDMREMDGASTEHLAHLGRLCAAGEFAAGLAHELQQPLCSIAIYADTCLRALGTHEMDTPAMHTALGDMRREAMRAAAVGRQLRRFVRKQSPTVQAVSLGQLVENAVGMTEYEARNLGVSLRTQIEDSLPPVFVEPIQIEQVFYNLIRNGLDAIAAHRTGYPEVVVAARLRDARTVEVAVTNSGGPVPEAVRQQMFEPFFTTKQEGLGVGLFLARAIITAHRGTIDCESNEQCTVLCLTLPAAP